jgi:hypothetical protein
MGVPVRKTGTFLFQRIQMGYGLDRQCPDPENEQRKKLKRW